MSKAVCVPIILRGLSAPAQTHTLSGQRVLELICGQWPADRRCPLIREVSAETRGAITAALTVLSLRSAINEAPLTSPYTPRLYTSLC